MALASLQQDFPHPGGDSPIALAVHGLSAGYAPGQSILHDLNFEIPRGACWAILGPSGSGKTTLLRTLLGLLAPVRGSVTRPSLTGADSRPRIGYIPQNLGLVRNASVRQNVLVGALNRLPRWRTLVGRFPAAERMAADEALGWVGLEGRGDERIESLSGGEKRRVAIARALLLRPHLLLADEFLAEVDKNTAGEIVALLHSLRERTGVTIVFVDHDVEAACAIADHVLVLVRGRNVFESEACETSPAEILKVFRTGLALVPDPALSRPETPRPTGFYNDVPLLDR